MTNTSGKVEAVARKLSAVQAMMLSDANEAGHYYPEHREWLTAHALCRLELLTRDDDARCIITNKGREVYKVYTAALEEGE